MLQAQGHSWKREFSAVFTERRGLSETIQFIITHLVQERYASV